MSNQNDHPTVERYRERQASTAIQAPFQDWAPLSCARCALPAARTMSALLKSTGLVGIFQHTVMGRERADQKVKHGLRFTENNELY